MFAGATRRRPSSRSSRLSENALKSANPEPHEQFLLIAGNVADAADCERAVAQTSDVLGQLSGLIHFSGIHSTITRTTSLQRSLPMYCTLM